jgi:hypothetical protein
MEITTIEIYSVIYRYILVLCKLFNYYRKFSLIITLIDHDVNNHKNLFNGRYLTTYNVNTFSIYVVDIINLYMLISNQRNCFKFL